MSVGVTVCYWFVQIFGTLMGLMFAFAAGAGKLLPPHPMNEMLSGAFVAVGQFLGLPGTPLRFFVGSVELFAGLGILGVLWVKSLADCEIFLALLICDFIGLITITIGIGWFHFTIEGSPGPAVMFLPVLLLLLFCRLQVTPISGFKDQSLVELSLMTNFPFSLLERFITLCLFGFLSAVLMRTMWGKSMAEMRADTEAAKASAE
mmetsp:Transcript_146830/g.256183  ORF Transcript_146830/g.256183 Transcript_146830/m.256183 type:complete len:205 (+) Transcript_146830:65-679(+)